MKTQKKRTAAIQPTTKSAAIKAQTKKSIINRSIFLITIALAGCSIILMQEASQKRERAQKERILAYILERKPNINMIDAQILQQAVIREAAKLQCRPDDELCEDMDRTGLLLGIIETESEFTRTARSRVGALGYMQLMPATARLVAKEPGMNEFQILVTDNNLRLGVEFFNYLLRTMKDVRMASLAYNAGPFAALQGRGVPSYWTKIVRNHDRFMNFVPSEDIQNRMQDALLSLAERMNKEEQDSAL